MFYRLIFLLLLFVQIAFADANKQELIIAGSNNWSPFSYVDEDKKAKGLLIDYWREFAKKNSVEITFILSDWQTSLENVKSGKADAHSGLLLSSLRKKSFDFTKQMPISLEARLYISRKINANNFNELKNKNIEVGITKSGYEEYFMKENYPDVKLKLYKNSYHAIEDAAKGKIYAFIADYPMSMHRLREAKISSKFHSDITLYRKYLHIGVKKDDAVLLNFINEGMKNIKKDDIERITNKWLLPIEVIPSWIAPLTISLIIFIIIVFLIFNIFLLKKQVKKRTKQLEELAYTDSLTKCFNRQKINEILSLEINRHNRYGHTVSIIMLDIDNFKHINDTFGHIIGDDVLINLTKILRENIRKVDFIGRWGGEEFVIICPETNIKNTAILANKLCSKINSYEFDQVKIVTASFGVSELQKNDDERTILIRADEALYMAKAEGKNRVKIF